MHMQEQMRIDISKVDRQSIQRQSKAVILIVREVFTDRGFIQVMIL